MDRLILTARVGVPWLLLGVAAALAIAVPIVDAFGWRELGTLCMGAGVLILASLFVREFRRILTGAAALAIALLVAPASALAASIELGQALAGGLAEAVTAIVSAGIAALAGWLFAIVRRKWHIDIAAGHRDALVTFLQRQASSLIAQGAVKVSGVKVEVSNQALADAANLALRSIPDAMKFFNLTPADLASRIVDMLPKEPAVAQAQAVALDVANPATPSGN